MRNKCILCGGSINFFHRYVCSPGKKRGDLEITTEQPICYNCQKNRLDYHNTEEFTEIFLLFKSGNVEEALKKQMENYNPNSPPCNYSVGNFLYNLNRKSEALEYYDTALFLDTRYVKAWYRKGELLTYFDRLQDAIKCFENVIELEPNNEMGWNLPAYFYRMLCLINIHNAAISSGGRSNLAKEINQSIIKLYPCILQLDGFSKEVYELKWLIHNKQVDSFITKFVDFCFEHFIEIMDFIEPNEVIQIHAPKRKWFFQN